MNDTSTPTEFHPNDNVLLLERRGDLRPGTRGRVVGRFAREETPTYVVRFEGDRELIAGDVRSEELVLVEDRASAA